MITLLVITLLKSCSRLAGRLAKRPAVSMALLLVGCVGTPSPVVLTVQPEPVPVASTDSDIWYSLLPNIDTAAIATTPGGTDAQVLSMIGREDLVARSGYWEYEERSCDLASDTDVMVEIARRARETSIVIVNESHVRSSHRGFIAELATTLRPLGYEVFAAESFANGPGPNDPMTSRPDESYFRLGDGAYNNEPAFGRLGRRLKGLGFELVAYEDSANRNELEPADRINARDEAQAMNLMEAVFADRPDAKVIVHVGYGHAREWPSVEEGGTVMLAARLKAKTGVDPLTIDQTLCRHADGLRRLTEPGRAFDLSVSHPPERFVRGRPSWRLDAGDILTAVPADLVPAEGWHVIEARPVGEPTHSVPMDRVAIRPGEANVALMLPPGAYTVRAIDLMP